MGETLGEAVLVLRTDDSALGGGIDKAEANAKGLDNTFRTTAASVTAATSSVGAAASQMAAQAQSAARAAVTGAAGIQSMGIAGNNTRLQLLELTHVGTALSGSLIAGINPARALAMELPRIAQAAAMGGTGIKGLIGEIAQMAGLVKTTVDAEAAEEAASASMAAAAVAAAAKIAQAKVMAADVEMALADAQVRSATTSEAEAAAQVRLAAAHEASAAAAEQAAIAENALAVAQGRAAAAQEAESATAVTAVTARGAMVSGVLAGLAVDATLTFLAFKQFQSQVADSGELDRYAESLGLTKKEMKELRQEVGGLSEKEMRDLSERAKAFEITWGDVWNGAKKMAIDALDLTPEWQKFKEGYADAWASALKGAADFAAASYGYVVGAYRTIVEEWKQLPAAFASAFTSAVNIAIDALNGLVKHGVDLLNGFIHQANKLPFVNISDAAVAPIAHITDSYAAAGKNAGKSFAQNVAEATAEAKTEIGKSLDTLWADIIGAAEQRIKNAASSIIEDRTPKKTRTKKPNDHGLAESLAELDAQIEGQYRLAAAYQVSDEAAIKATALQKAEEEAIRHKGDVGVFYEKELALAVATRAAEGAKTIADLRDETAARTKINDAVAAGLVPASQMQAQLELEAKLRPLLAAYDLADAAHKQLLAEEIQNLTQAQADSNREAARAQALQQEASNSDELERLKLEASLIGASNRQRAVALAQLQAMQKLRDMPGMSPEDQQAYVKSFVDAANASVQTPFQEWAASVPQTAEAINDALEGIATKGLSELNDGIADAIVNSKSLGEAFHKVAQDMLADLIKLALKEAEMALFKGIFGSAFGGGMGFGGFHAGGGLIPQGTVGIVGERGPEPIVATPKGAMVFPNSTLRSGMSAANGNSVSVTNYNDFRGADPAAVAAIEGRIDRMQRELPSTIVSTMHDARQRFVWR